MTILGIIALVLSVVLGVYINKLYHELFNVTYFGFGALIKEWAVCWMIGLLIVIAVFMLFGLDKFLVK